MGTRMKSYNDRTATILFITDCANCGVIFAITEALEDRRRADQKIFYCPNGHGMSFQGKTDAQKLREATARETALQDQLEASIREGEAGRVELARIRQRIAHGVCPCCSRSFDNVRRHMASKHPEFAAEVPVEKRVKFGCGCGLDFPTFRGLRTHQGLMRPDDWAKPGKKPWQSHLTAKAGA